MPYLIYNVTESTYFTFTGKLKLIQNFNSVFPFQKHEHDRGSVYF